MNTRTKTGLAGGAALLTLAAWGAARAQDKPAPLLEHTFDLAEQGWTSFGQGAKVSVDDGAGQAKEGKAALRFDYALKKGDLNVLLLPTPDGLLAKMKSLRFWVKSEAATPFAVALQETGGGRYTATLTVPKGQWQKVELGLSDFVLNRGPGDPADSNEKLDLDIVEAVALSDFMTILVQAEDANLRRLLGIEEGARTLRLDTFVVSAEPLPDTVKKGEAEVVLDTFARPQVGWFVVGRASVKTSSAKPLEGAGLQADYTQTPSSIMGMGRSVPLKTLTGMKELRLTAAASKPMKLIVQVEEAGGGKYNTMIDVPDGSKPETFALPFADFKPADDSKDDNNKLDLDKVQTVLLLDLSGPLTMIDRDTTFWVNGVKAAK